MGEEINPPVPLPGTRTGSCQPVTSRPHNQVLLEFRNGHQHVEEHPGTSSGGINPLTQGQQPHTLVLQIISDLLEVSRQTTESIRLGHVRRLFYDAEGSQLSDSTGYYIVREGDDGLQACVCVQTDDVEKLHAPAAERGIDINEFMTG